jgi:hypothetical protein
MSSSSLQTRIDRVKPLGRLAWFGDFVAGGLFPQFAALVAGFRPGMDVWVHAKSFDEFENLAINEGLCIDSDVAFGPLSPKEQADAIGAQNLTTTFAKAVPLEEAKDEDEIHVFLGKTESIVKNLRSSGWYPVVVNGRVMQKPFIDHLQFGRLLGYPQCCINHFERSNDWVRTNTYAVSFLHSEGRFDYRTNCFGKHRNFSLNFHMPCSFNCAETIQFSSRLERYLEDSEKDYIATCRS